MSEIAFRELRVAAGYKVPALANKLLVKEQTAYAWEYGHRPAWVYMGPLAKIFGIEAAELVSSLWNETVGDRCECGCGSKKVLPVDFPEARRLVFERTCGRCGQKRTYKIKKDHRPFCQSCARIRERIVLNCVGYRDPLWKKDGAKRRGPKCLRKLRLLKSTLDAYQRRARQAKSKGYKQWGEKQWQDPGKYGPLQWAPAFRDESSRTFRCESCANSSFMVALNDARIKPFIQGERIRSRNERREIMSAFFEELNPTFAKKKKRWRGGRKLGSKNQRQQFWSKVSFKLSRCVFCKKLTFSDSSKTIKSHRQCYLAWLKTLSGKEYCRLHWGSMPSIGAGQPVSGENLLKYLAWAEQHYFKKKSYREIADADGVHFTTVRQRIEFILANLPNPSLLPRRFQSRVSSLLETPAPDR